MARNPRQNLYFLRNFLAGVSADIFFHFWNTPDAEFVVAMLDPVRYVFDDPGNVPPPPVALRRERFTPPTRERVIASMHYSIGRANELKRTYEQEHGFRYDVVVRLRADFFSTTRLADILDRVWSERSDAPEAWARTLYVPDQAHAAGITDQFAVGSSEAIDLYSSGGAALDTFAAGNYLTAEYFLLRHARVHGLRIRTVPFEYVLLRDDTISTFDLERLIRQTRAEWWSTQLPDVGPDRAEDFLVARADSAALMDALDFDTARVFRLRTASRGYVRFGGWRGGWSYVADAASASLFFVVVAGDTDKTLVNIRPRDLVLQRGTSRAARDPNVNLRPDAAGRMHADGAPDLYSAFLVGGDPVAGVTFEWAAGHWTTVDADWGEATRRPGGPAHDAALGTRPYARRYLSAAANGLALAPEGTEPERFRVEYVPDAAAEAAPVGIIDPDRPPRSVGPSRGSRTARTLSRAAELAHAWAENGSAWLAWRVARSAKYRGRHTASRVTAAVRRRLGAAFGGSRAAAG